MDTDHLLNGLFDLATLLAAASSIINGAFKEDPIVQIGFFILGLLFVIIYQVREIYLTLSSTNMMSHYVDKVTRNI